MTIKVGINGFGRVGRMVLRAISSEFADDFEVVGINDLLEPDYLAYMLKYDSVHGNFNGDVRVKDDVMIVNGQRILMSSERDPAEISWEESGAELIFECTGFFRTEEGCQKHLDAGAKKVVISAPSKDATPMFVYGVNHESYAGEAITSAASCTTNCLAPVAKILNDKWGIKRALMTTVHAATSSQKTVDGPSPKDWRRGRGLLENIIPTSTGAAKAVGLVLPELAGKLDGSAIRVPTPNVSVVDLTFTAGRNTTAEEINAALQAAAADNGADGLHGILATTDLPLVSMDFNHALESSIAAIDQTKVQDGNLVRVLSWYDNEWGFSNRMLDTAVHMGNL